MHRNFSKDSNCNSNNSCLSEHKDKLIQAIKRIKRELDQCREAERETYVESVAVENGIEGLEREIRAEFRNLHRFLDEEEEKDLQRLERERQKLLKLLKEREKKIAEQGRQLETAIAVLNDKLAEEDSPRMLKEIQDLLKRCQVRFNPPAEVDSDVRSGQFVGPIQYRVWKHMKSCLYPNVTPVTFDLETAHPQLSVSASRTSVWFEELKNPAEPPLGPKQFSYYYSVFGQQGFTTGRHYWEVDVGDKTAWRLGVAREDIPRGEMASTGTWSGLWTLSLKEGNITACTDPTPSKIHISAHVCRVGVFLDCEKEEVSFYNAITMAPLYTFTTGSVPVPLFPFFNPCDTDDGQNTASMNIFRPAL
ncbi:zinc-binding protein A33 [Synchiropus picturatus]